MTVSSPVSAGRQRITSALEIAERSVFPSGGVRTSLAEGTVVFALGAVAAFFRVGTGALAGRIWAEDGSVFLQQAYGVGPLRSVTVQYAGYLSVVPRSSAAAVFLLPMSWQGVGLHVVAAVIEALIGLVAYVATAAVIAPRWARALLALCVVTVPVGPEITGNIANLQWFVMFGASVAVLWTPRTRLGWAAICLLVIGATTSSPFGFVILLAFGVRLLIQRNRQAALACGAATFGFLIQIAAMIHAPTRQISSNRRLNAGPLSRGYVNRVLGDGVFGVGRLSLNVHRSLTAGFVVLVVAVLLTTVLLMRRSRAVFGFAVPLVLLSLITYLLPVGLNAAPVDNPFADSRYYVTPALLIEAALLALATRALVGATESRTFGAVDKGVRLLGRVLALFMIGSLLFGLGDSYSNGSFADRNTGERWSTGVSHARNECRGAPGTTVIHIPILPAGWSVQLTCADVRSG